MYKEWKRKIQKGLLNSKLIRRGFDSLIWFVTKNLSDKQKQAIKKRLPLKMKELLKRAVSGERYSGHDQVNQIKYKMLNLGFEGPAYAELYRLATNEDNHAHTRREAMWELALWHADRQTREDAKIGLKHIVEYLDKEKNKTRKRQGIILQIELLDFLGEKEHAKIVLNKELEVDNHPDLLLAAANLETTLEKKLGWINALMKQSGLAEIQVSGDKSKPVYDQLITLVSRSKIMDVKDIPKVSVIMPVFNAEQVVETALKSVLEQTWRNIELIIIDDCSTDNTMNIIKQFANNDSRIIVLSTDVNSGTYVARNIGLKIATGEFVTCHDADDWSHAQKIEIQALHLIRNKKLVGNLSEQCRMTEELLFYRRKQQRFYIFGNMSSLMFRRVEVQEYLGYWDNVRFGADGEFIRRIRKQFGIDSVVSLNLGPLSFPRVSSTSLTENGAFGYYGFFFGARKEYVESFTFHHNQAETLKYDMLPEARPFPIPEPMKPSRGEVNKSRHFDVIIVSDFRLAGGTTSSNEEEIKAQRYAGLKTGLIQLSSYKASGVKDINPKIRSLIDGDAVQILVYGESVTCDVLIVRHPPILQEKQKYFPEVKADRVCVIVNQTPRIDYGENGQEAYDIERCQLHLKQYFGQWGMWYPISPQVRRILSDHHEDELTAINVADEDWVNIINIEEWKRELHRKGSKTRIGRHSRDQYVKWPSDPKQLLEIYPDSELFEIHILGGAKVPEKTLGKLPWNWIVWEFGERESKDFLAELDVFVYYVHPYCVEAFGRVIIEAMAVGVPVVLPYSYYSLFGEAAIYAEPHEVQEKIGLLIKNEMLLDIQVQRARQLLAANFDYSSHIKRL
ncbi:hypothetical protein JCM10914A_14770 [Paenibacillus sp. JCM 10914]|uniref:glycosyltransferase n=1 Tax=Paenibacillus sp. JCM 10914 TaxID=1236974 RepID=UPI0003CC8A5A|nr:glycosyltransferase [Paenibacillus sp. JCM 10914]GAE09674.1 glycosyltransferase [Paenibacillus sp. JCM 10914]